MAYFDNAATTYPKPQEVYSAMDEFYRICGGSAGRGSYSKAVSAKAIIDETRLLIQNLLHCPAKQVIFEPTATIALNIIIQGMIEKGLKTVYISPFEHNAVTRTLFHFENLKRIKVFELPVGKDFTYDLIRTKSMFDSNKPDFVIVSHASNVIGLIAPIEDIFMLAKKYGAVTLVDMAQTAGLVDINVGLETIDFAVFAGHKSLMGPTGISGFVMKPDVLPSPVLFGGTGYDSANQDMPSDLPERYEMGTLNIAGIAGLNAALRWINMRGIDELYKEELKNRNRLLVLLSQYDYISVVGWAMDQKYIGIVSCLFDGLSSDSVGPILNEYGIAARTGLQCAPRAHSFLKTYPAGTVRFSVNAFTTNDDFDDLKNSLDSIRDLL